MKSVRKYEKGGKQKGTVRAGKDYTNDKQAIAAGVTIDYSDPFRNLTEKDRAFLKKNLAGYGEGGETKIRMSEGGSRDGGYYNAQQVANARKALLKQSLRTQGKAGQGKQKVVGGPSIPMSAPFGYEPKKEKTKERIEGTRVIGPDEEGGKGRKDNVLIRTGDKEEIRKEVQGAMDAARKKMLKK
tara:strand:+ start:361 stop:915 length:555 start_codon:yes stop_codon:yes gene_type:complete